MECSLITDKNFHRLTLDVYTAPLGRCDVDWHVDRGIVAVACAGRDLIKAWPPPVEQPWWEDEIAPDCLLQQVT